MRQSFEYLPRREDYFPKLKRGHGSREAHLCVDETCNLNQPKSKNLHHDSKANLTEWCEQRRLSLTYQGPIAMMLFATGGK